MSRRARYFGLVVVLVAVVASFGIVDDAFAPPFLWKKGLILNNAANVFPGWVIFADLDGIIHVVSQGGADVLTINPPVDFEYSNPRPLENGNILAALNSQVDSTRSIIEIDQAGNTVWEFFQPAPYVFHHDHRRLPNGNTLITCAQLITIPSISSTELEDDCLLEVDPAGTVVWAWHTWEHFDDFDFSPEVEQGIFDKGGDWAHSNAGSPIPPNPNQADPRFTPGNIIISYRFINKVVIVDRATGDIVWQTEMDPPTTIGQHDPELIETGLPGAGNILIFDNGLGGIYANSGSNWARSSRIIELDPTDLSEVWEWNATLMNRPDWEFNSWFVSSVQRLPNGNTFINEGAFGHLMEIAPNGRVVWDYVNPNVGPFGGQGWNSTFLYRAEKAPFDWLQP